jgi:hypothetical protein
MHSASCARDKLELSGKYRHSEGIRLRLRLPRNHRQSGKRILFKTMLM